MRAEVKVLIVIILAALLAYFAFQPSEVTGVPVHIIHIRNFTKLSVLAGNKIYTLTVDGKINNSEVCVVFYRGIPTKVVQRNRVYNVLSWTVRSTVEKFPEVRP